MSPDDNIEFRNRKTQQHKMSINLTKRKYLLYLTLITLLLSGVGGVTYFSLVPEHYFGGYPFIPVYFFLFGLFEISMFDACRKHAPQKMLLLYMAMKVMKMLLSVILLVVYCFAVREEAKLFLLTFILYYIVYLIYETWFFFTYEVGKKQKKEKKMEFIIDTVNLEDIKEAVEYMPIVGVTSNPSIVKKTSPKDFFKHMKEVRKIIGKERSLHIQVISKECDEIVKEAHRILEEIDDQVYIKVPVSYEGIKAIKQLKAEGINVTATAVYDLMQAYMALAAGADYIAPYVNRIGNLGNDPMELIDELSNRIVQDGYDCKILAASFKGVQQVRDAFNYGSQAITAPVEVLKQIFANPSIEKAVNDFNSDWYDVYGEGKGICDL